MALRDLARRARDGARDQLIRQEARKLHFADPRLEALRVALRVPAAGADARCARIEARRAELEAATDVTARPVASPDQGRLLYRLVVALGPHRCLALGPSAGIPGAYLGAGLEQRGTGRLVTLEGREAEALPDVLADLGEVHLAVVGGQQAHAPTLAAFAAILERAVPGTVLVLDDVAHDGVARAWREIREHPRVTGSLTIGPVGFAVVDGVPDAHAELAGLALW